MGDVVKDAEKCLASDWGKIPYKKLTKCTIESREVTDPLLCGTWEEGPMPTIREEKPDEAKPDYDWRKVLAEKMAKFDQEREYWEKQPVPDVREVAAKTREEGVIGNSGAEAFFCDTNECVREKDQVLKLCGLECHDDILDKMLSDLCDEYRKEQDRIKRIQKGLEKQEKVIEALATKMGYEQFSFSDKGVTMTRTQDNYSFHLPPETWTMQCGVMKKKYGTGDWE